MFKQLFFFDKRGKLKPDKYTVDVGNHYLNEDEYDGAVTKIKVAQIVMHPMYKTRTMHNDIAMIKLAVKSNFYQKSTPWCF